MQPVVENEAAYADVVAAGPDGALLRQLFVHRANHCIFTPAEQIAAFQVLFNRLDGGSWGTTDAAALNDRAASRLMIALQGERSRCPLTRPTSTRRRSMRDLESPPLPVHG